MADWQDSLRQFLDSNPDIAPGDTPVQEPPATPAPAKERLDIILDRKGRAGKVATIICGFADTTSDDAIAGIAKALKQQLGRGGSVRGGEILIQGDCRDRVMQVLGGLGYKSRKI